MSIITIQTEDNQVVIDGEIEMLAFTGDPTIAAIHWDTVLEEGEIEYKSERANGVTTRKENEFITNFAPYQHFIADHATSKSAREQQVLDDLAAKIVARDAANQAVFDDSDNAGKAFSKYPGTEIHLHALYEARQGDTTLLDAIDATYAAADAEHGV